MILYLIEKYVGNSFRFLYEAYIGGKYVDYLRIFLNIQPFHGFLQPNKQKIILGENRVKINEKGDIMVIFHFIYTIFLVISGGLDLLNWKKRKKQLLRLVDRLLHITPSSDKNNKVSQTTW